MMRVRRMIAAAVLLFGAASVPARVASAHDDNGDDHDEETTTTFRTQGEGEVGIGDGFFLREGVVVPLADGETRSLDALQTAVWVQSWMPSAFFGTGIEAELPTGLEVYRVDATGDWAGHEGTVSAYFATDGTTPYVSFPGLVVWTAPDEPPPVGDVWFTPPARVIDAFNGEAELLETTGTQQATSSVAPSEEVAADSDDDSSSPAWVIPAAVGAALVIGGGLWLGARRRRSEPASP